MDPAGTRSPPPKNRPALSSRDQFPRAPFISAFPRPLLRCTLWLVPRLTPAESTLHFMACINQHDPGKLVELMTVDHLFVDSLGHSVRGREKMLPAWSSFYAFCSDYWVTHDAILSDGNLVAVFGAAGGTIDGTEWRIPAAWRAVVENGFIKEWKVYADSKPAYDILGKRKL
jgi:hypothetical protein